jgi:hypothetical protein
VPTVTLVGDEMVTADCVSLLTVRVKVVLVVSAPSLTVRVRVAVPVWLAAGVTVTVRLAPLPPNTMAALGTKVVFEDVPLIVRLATAVSASPTVKASGPTAVPIGVVWFVTVVIVGAVFAVGG